VGRQNAKNFQNGLAVKSFGTSGVDIPRIGTTNARKNPNEIPVERSARERNNNGINILF